MKKPLPENRRVRRPVGPVAAPVDSFASPGDDAEPVARSTSANKKTSSKKKPAGPSRLAERLATALRVARVVAGVAVFGATVAGASYGLYRYVSTTRRFAIKDVTVEGARHRTEADIARLGGLEVGKNVFAVDLDQARRDIGADPWIERAIVTRKLPGTVNVKVVEREPTAVVALGDALYLASAGGEVFKRLEQGDPTDLVVISGAFGEGELIRDRAGVMALVKRAQDVIADYDRAVTDKRFPLQEVHLGDEGGVSLVVARDPVVLMLGKPPYRPKLERAARVLAELERRKGQATTIYFDNDAHPERVVARLR